MTGRREFLLFVGCALMPQAHAQVRRREVRVAGRRIKTIDVHAHCVIPEAEALMKHKSAGVYAITWEERLKRLDAQGIDMQALSINPTWYGLERDLATKVIELQNEKLAELCARHRDRLVAFASVALQYPDLAARQLEQAVKKLGLRGGSAHEEGHRVLAAGRLRFARLPARGAAPPRGAGRHLSPRGRHRRPVRLDEDRGGARLRYARVERC